MGKKGLKGVNRAYVNPIVENQRENNIMKWNLGADGTYRWASRLMGQSFPTAMQKLRSMHLLKGPMGSQLS